MNKHIIIYSHGFGVRKDDRGLFTDISAGLQDMESIMFDYSQIDETSNVLIATSLDEQAEKLRGAYREVKTNHPTATIDLVCHSQGCVIAAMSGLEGIRKIIFLAPPDDNFGRNIEQKVEQMERRPGAQVLEDGSLSYPRRDGSTTVIPARYWEGREGARPVALYQKIVEQTELIIVVADSDEVIGTTDFASLGDKAKIIYMPTGHNFEDEARGRIIELLCVELA